MDQLTFPECSNPGSPEFSNLLFCVWRILHQGKNSMKNDDFIKIFLKSIIGSTAEWTSSRSHTSTIHHYCWRPPEHHGGVKNHHRSIKILSACLPYHTDLLYLTKDTQRRCLIRVDMLLIHASSIFSSCLHPQGQPGHSELYISAPLHIPVDASGWCFHICNLSCVFLL